MGIAASTGGRRALVVALLSLVLVLAAVLSSGSRGAALLPTPGDADPSDALLTEPLVLDDSRPLEHGGAPTGAEQADAELGDVVLEHGGVDEADAAAADDDDASEQQLTDGAEDNEGGGAASPASPSPSRSRRPATRPPRSRMPSPRPPTPSRPPLRERAADPHQPPQPAPHHSSGSSSSSLTPGEIIARSALLIAAHKWSPGIAAGMQPFVSSALCLGMDVHVLGVSTLAKGDVPLEPHVRNLPEWERRDLARRGVAPGNLYTAQTKWENALRTFHSRAGVLGFRSPWLSNHILLWAWHHKYGAPRNYTRVWSLESDVRGVGNLTALWAHAPRAAYVSTSRVVPLREGHWAHKEFTGDAYADPAERFYALKQVWAASADFIRFADGLFTAGVNGQDETILASMAMDFVGGNRARLGDLREFAAHGWTWDPKASRRMARAWRDAAHLHDKWTAQLERDPGNAAAAGKLAHLLPNGLKLFHPVKE